MKRNKEVTKVVKLANKIGGLYASTEEYFSEESLDAVVGIYLVDLKSNMTLTIEVDDYSDKKDISDELYMLADDFNEEFTESELIPDLKKQGYTDEDIDRMRKHINTLYKDYTFG